MNHQCILPVMTDNNIIDPKSGDCEKQHVETSGDAGEVTAADERLVALGYKPQFRREMSLFGVLGISFCAIGILVIFVLLYVLTGQRMNKGILTGMSSAFQTGLFSGGPLGLFWGWNVGLQSIVLGVPGH